MTDIVAETELSAIAARFQLLRLGPKVVRVSPRQPLFLIVGPEHRSLGSPSVSGWLHDYFVSLRQGRVSAAAGGVEFRPG